MKRGESSVSGTEKSMYGGRGRRKPSESMRNGKKSNMNESKKGVPAGSEVSSGSRRCQIT